MRFQKRRNKMDTGITVLNTVISNDSMGCGFAILFGVVTGCLLGLFYYVIYGFLLWFKMEIPKTVNVVAILSIIVLSAILLVNIHQNEQYENYNKYQVLIGDDVKYNEFMDRYTILSQDGNIYTIIEKETNTVKRK